MINRAKIAPVANVQSPAADNSVYMSGRFAGRQAPLARMLLTIAVVAVSIALAVLTGWGNRTNHAPANHSGYLR